MQIWGSLESICWKAIQIACQNCELLVNGLVYELGQFRFEHNIGWRVFEQWITVTFNEGNLKASVERLLKKVRLYETKQKRLGKVITEVIHYQNIELYKHAVRQMTMLYYHIRIWLLNSTTRLKNCRGKAEIKGELILSEKLQSERRRCKSRYRQIKRPEVALEQQKSDYQKKFPLKRKQLRYKKSIKQALAAKER